MDISGQSNSVDHLAISKLFGATLLFCMVTVLPGCTSSQLAVPAPAGLQSGEIAVETDVSGEGPQVAMVVSPAEPEAQPQVQVQVQPQPQPESQPRYNHDDVVWIQQRLQDLGYYNGDIDGSVGRATRTAIEEYQQEQDVPADGLPTTKLREFMWRNGG
jgi:hypothetical protein